MTRNFLTNQYASRQFLAFLVTGGIAALTNFGSRLAYNQWMSYSSAIILAYITGMIVAYLLARMFVFTSSRQPLSHSVLFFLLINLLAVTQTWLVSMLLAYQLLPALGIQTLVPEIAHAVGIVVPVFTSYLGHKYWSFR
ncbi:MAG: GtrA family protein [Pseudohongiella sp.]|nr:GtrA family protein [Pseudohongiella sp.]MDO9521752.1 GtrA family protein [Pseudohongiella sp.]MDP2128700.1 GtrA family protein [Pseudohongiella sp.]